jgi:ATP-dependent exoDNAse (exonuclease V) beta subunit
MIFDEELKIAGSIDMVFENEDGTLSIYDWKRCKEINQENTWNKFATNEVISHLPDTNYWHYSLQLNTYKAILERKYGKIVKELYLVKLHPDDPNDSYELIEVPILSEEINNLFQQRIQKL